MRARERERERVREGEREKMMGQVKLATFDVVCMTEEVDKSHG